MVIKKKKKSVNYRLLNILILCGIIFLLYQTGGLLTGILNKVFNVIYPFIIAFAIAYALYPFVLKLQNKGLPKWLAVLITSLLSIGLFVVSMILVIPILYDQILLFISNISTFIADISSKYEINLGTLQSTLAETSSDIIKSFGNYISNGLVGFINASFGIVAAVVIIIFVVIYLLIDMDKIREAIKGYFSKKKKKWYNYIKTLDREITNYFSGMGKNMLIQFIEYTLAFFIIGHPNYLILGILAAITNIIPYFGGFIVNVLALIIASVISTKLTVLTLIICLVCPQLDSYVIGPRVFGKSNNLHPLVNIFAVFAGGALFGFWGIIVSLPVAITIITTYKYFRHDINNKIDSIKEKI